MIESRNQFEEWIKAERPRLFLDYLTTYSPNQYADPAIAYLRALLSGDELTTIPGQEKCYEDWLSRQKLMKLNKCKCGGDALVFKKKLSDIRTEGGVLLSKLPEYEGVNSFFWAECLKCQNKSRNRFNYCEAVENWNNQKGE